MIRHWLARLRTIADALAWAQPASNVEYGDGRTITEGMS
jgi:hypothetical protein